jgi:hypothetical protein
MGKDFFLHGSTAVVGLGLLYEVPGQSHLDAPQDNDISWPNSLLNVIRVRFRKEIREKKE